MHIGVFVGQLRALRRHDSGGGLFKKVISVVHGAGLSKKKRSRQTQAALNGGISSQDRAQRWLTLWLCPRVFANLVCRCQQVWRCS